MKLPQNVKIELLGDDQRVSTSIRTDGDCDDEGTVAILMMAVTQYADEIGMKTRQLIELIRSMATEIERQLYETPDCHPPK